MEVERVISWFDKSTAQFCSEYRIDDKVSFDDLKLIFKQHENDPLMFMVYGITLNEANRLSQYIDLDFNFEKYRYQLDCFQAGT